MNEKTINLPIDYEDRMKSDLGESFNLYRECLEKKAVRGLRVNLGKISAFDFEKMTTLKLKKLSFCDDGYILEDDEKIGNSPEHLSGLYYMQEPSSMISVISSQIDKETRPLKILDLCASPGGKTGQIASRVSSDSIIFSNEIIKSRADVLYSNVERLGLKNVIILNEEPKNLLCFEGYFDYVFVDAPCSGEGMFRKNPNTISEWSLSNVEACAKRQKEILDIAERLVCQSGKLIYSTCTFSKKEDEEIIKWFIEKYNFEILPVPNCIKDVTVKCETYENKIELGRKFFPFSGDGEGQFVCVMEKKNKADEKLYSKKHFNTISLIGRNDFLLFEEFTKNNMIDNFSYKSIYKLGNNLFYVPKLFNEKLQTALDGLKIISLGVKLGSIEKRRFEPNHCIFMSFFDNFKRKIEINDEMLKKYLHGEELNFCNIENGYAVITFKNFALGGAKVSSGRIKNLLPKGLRI